MKKKFRYFVLNLIRIYQKYLSPDQGYFYSFYPFLGACRFRPTCSQYAYQAIRKYGILKGGLKAFWRILRCHPFSKGGWDPLN